MSKIHHEELFHIRVLAPEIPSNRPGKPVDLSTVFKWTTIGIRKYGRVIRLETITRGGSTMTSREAIQRFFDECTAARIECAERKLKSTPNASR